MKITDDNIDDLFRSQLDKENQYDNADHQWKTVYAQLNQKDNRKPLFWILSLSFLVLSSLCFLFISSDKNIQSTSEAIATAQPIQKPITPVESTKTTSTKPTSKIDTHRANPKPLANNQETKSAIIQTNPTINTSINKFNSETTISSESISDRQLCNCPDDALYNSLTQDPTNSDTQTATPLLNPNGSTTKNSPYYSTPTTIALNNVVNNKQNNNHLEKIHNLNRQLHLLDRSTSLYTIGVDKMDTDFFLKIKPTATKPRKRFSFACGLLKDYYNSAFIDTTAIAPYFELGFAATQKLTFNISYNQKNNLRALTSGFDSYDYTNIYTLPDQAEISKGILAYKEQTIDLGVQYYMTKLGPLELSILGGLQIDNQSEGTISFVIDNLVYITNEQTYPLPRETLGLRKSYLGIGLNIPILSSLNLEFRYKRIIPLSNVSIDWKSYNRLSFGLSYKLNNQS